MYDIYSFIFIFLLLLILMSYYFDLDTVGFRMDLLGHGQLDSLKTIFVQFGFSIVFGTFWNYDKTFKVVHILLI